MTDDQAAKSEQRGYTVRGTAKNYLDGNDVNVVWCVDTLDPSQWGISGGEYLRQPKVMEISMTLANSYKKPHGGTNPWWTCQ
jgi:hypothetical protein